MAAAVSYCQPFHHSAALQGEVRGSGSRSQEGIAVTSANTVRFERSLGTGFTGLSQSLRVLPARLSSLTLPARAPGVPRVPGPPILRAGVCRLGVQRTLKELGRARRPNERAPRRARLPPSALIGPAACEAGLAGRGCGQRLVPRVSGSGARAPRRPPTLPAAFSLPPFSSLPGSRPALSGSGRALAGLCIAHSGGAAVFVGWGSGLPLAAGIRTQPG